MSHCDNPNKNLILCIGEDRRIHVCEPHKDQTECGIKVIKKDVSDTEFGKLFSCWECTY